MIFNTLDKAWHNEMIAVLASPHQSSRSGVVRELIGRSFTLSNVDHTFLMNKRRAASPIYASAELLWYLSGSSDVDMMCHYAPQYRNFSEDDGFAHGAYGLRIEAGFAGSQLRQVIDLLKTYPSTRQAVIQLWSPRDLWYALNATRKDIPCTVCWQFIRRYDELHMITYMRSNDLWLGTPYDVYCFTIIQRLIAEELEIRPASYTHNVGSLHLYQKNEVAARESMECDPREFEKLSHYWENYKGLAELDDAVLAEEFHRTSKDSEWANRTLSSGTVLYDAVHTTFLQRENLYEDKIRSEQLLTTYRNMRKP